MPTYVSDGPIWSLPVDCIVMVAMFLPVLDVSSLSATCRGMFHVCNLQALWDQLYMRDKASKELPIPESGLMRSWIRKRERHHSFSKSDYLTRRGWFPRRASVARDTLDNAPFKLSLVQKAAIHTRLPPPPAPKTPPASPRSSRVSFLLHPADRPVETHSPKLTAVAQASLDVVPTPYPLQLPPDMSWVKTVDPPSTEGDSPPIPHRRRELHPSRIPWVHTQPSSDVRFDMQGERMPLTWNGTRRFEERADRAVVDIRTAGFNTFYTTERTEQAAMQSSCSLGVLDLDLGVVDSRDFHCDSANFVDVYDDLIAVGTSASNLHLYSFDGEKLVDRAVLGVEVCSDGSHGRRSSLDRALNDARFTREGNLLGVQVSGRFPICVNLIDLETGEQETVDSRRTRNFWVHSLETVDKSKREVFCIGEHRLSGEFGVLQADFRCHRPIVQNVPVSKWLLWPLRVRDRCCIVHIVPDNVSLHSRLRVIDFRYPTSPPTTIESLRLRGGVYDSIVNPFVHPDSLSGSISTGNHRVEDFTVDGDHLLALTRNTLRELPQSIWRYSLNDLSQEPELLYSWNFTGESQLELLSVHQNSE
ncbi:MAG: uncharacterized protein KVP18_004762 [Porospora cf. gigantea A]|uniref:uncharacterized protein n=1 Tax=Porospora cf. gigantea A TaxID=2853593 RepID=UPI00355ABE3F|nr:MAG: hypothetical protein KVP18_004762 [Porospora cf. gigantea A]